MEFSFLVINGSRFYSRKKKTSFLVNRNASYNHEHIFRALLLITPENDTAHSDVKSSVIFLL